MEKTKTYSIEGWEYAAKALGYSQETAQFIVDAADEWLNECLPYTTTLREDLLKISKLEDTNE